MDVAKLFTEGGALANDYVAQFGRTLALPMSFWSGQSRAAAAGIPRPEGGSEAGRTSSLGAGTFGFALVSIALGSALQAAIPQDKAETVQEIVVLCVVLGMWLLHACLLHVAARLLGGGAALAETIEVSVRVLASLYLVCSFVTFVGVTIISSLGLFPSLGSPASLIYFSLNFVLVSVYLFTGVAERHALSGTGKLVVLFAVSTVLNGMFDFVGFVMFLLIHFAAHA